MSPQPNIVRTLRRLEAPLGLSYALVEDDRSRFWVEQKCPVGTHYWTVAQAASLPHGVHTGPVLREIVLAGKRREAALRQQINLLRPRLRVRAETTVPVPCLPSPSRRTSRPTRYTAPRETVAA